MAETATLRHRSRFGCAALLTVLFGVPSAHASQSYTSLPSFLGALGQPYTLYDFDGLAHGTVLTSQLQGVDFLGTGTVANASIIGGTAHTPPNVVRNTSSSIEFHFARPTRGVGFFNTGVVDEVVTYAAWPQGGTLFQTLVPPGGFLGFISDTPIGIGSIGWIGPPNSTFSIDTFIFRTTDTATVPASRPEWLGALAVALAVAATFGLRRRARDS